MPNRCQWATKNPIEQKYHDEEWGIPIYDDRLLFEMLNLEGQQSGLSWSTILAKRETFAEAFANWDAKKIAKFDEQKIEELMQNPGVIRHRLKIQAIIANAKAFLEIQKEYGDEKPANSRTDASKKSGDKATRIAAKHKSNNKALKGFAKFIWKFVDNKPIKNQWQTLSEIPSKTKISEEMSKTLKKKGFKFVGPTTCYAFMQAAGLVNDHTVDCFRYESIISHPTSF